MITHPFLVWLNYNASNNRRIRQVALCAKRTVWPLGEIRGNETIEELVAYMTKDVHEEDADWVRSNIDGVFAAYETWAFGCWEDWQDEYEEWKKPLI